VAYTSGDVWNANSNSYAGKAQLGTAWPQRRSFKDGVELPRRRRGALDQDAGRVTQDVDALTAKESCPSECTVEVGKFGLRGLLASVGRYDGWVGVVAPPA
jgi:hypothetical protein